MTDLQAASEKRENTVAEEVAAREGAVELILRMHLSTQQLEGVPLPLK